MHSFAAALHDLEDLIAAWAVGVERVPLASAWERVLAEDVALDGDVPPFRRAAMDGFALWAADVVPGNTLPVVGGRAAGGDVGGVLQRGTAWRVMTGAPVPLGTERVVPFEWTLDQPGSLSILRVPDAATHVVEAGEHARAGTVVLRRGARVDAGAVAAAISAGRDALRVARKPRVVALGTGDELVAAGEALAPGRIRNSNGPYLAFAAAALGCAAEDFGIAPDQPAGLARCLEEALTGADIVLASGGASRGDHDLVPGTFERLGVKTLFHGWAVQPGGPLYCGSRGETLVVGLPGNPAASTVGFETLVRPAIAMRLGSGFCVREEVPVRYVGPWGKPSVRRRFRPADLELDAEGRLLARARPWHGSGDPFAFYEAGAWVVLHEDEAAPPTLAVDRATGEAAVMARALLFQPPRARSTSPRTARVETARVQPPGGQPSRPRPDVA